LKEAKKEEKIAKQLEEEQLRSLLNEGISNQFGKNKKASQNTASKLGIAEGSISHSLSFQSAQTENAYISLDNM